MTKQEEFIKSVKNNSKCIIELLKDKEVDPANNFNWAICHASEYGYIDIVRLLLKDEKIDPSASKNYPLNYSSCNLHIDIVKLLLKDKRVDPTSFNNWTIKTASFNQNTIILNLLWKDKRIKNTLQKDDPVLYKELIQQDIKNKLIQF